MLSLGVPEDNYEETRRLSQHIAHQAGEWAGIPTPIDGERMVVEDRHRLKNYCDQQQENGQSDELVLNTWRLSNKRQTVYVWKRPTSGSKVAIISDGSVFSKDFKTAACAVAWSMRAERQALRFLQNLISPYAYKTYTMTGMFIEQSKRSGVYYMFRRLRPTVAARPTRDEKDMRILAALCLHPVGYYARTWAGALCPTDDVISHLLMMRGDEKLYWKRANQIAPEAPEAGIL